VNPGYDDGDGGDDDDAGGGGDDDHHGNDNVIYRLGHGLCASFLQCLGQLSLLHSMGR